MSDDRNPSAFPHLNPNYDGNWNKKPQHGGMTLRDYFAAAALPSVMVLCARDTMIPGETIEEAFARKSLAIADAMLAARQEPTS
jgi:hypothetical protein